MNSTTGTLIDTSDARIGRAIGILANSGSWLKVHGRDGSKSYGIRSTRDANRVYLVTAQHCSCEDFRRRQLACKHVLAVRLLIATVKAQQSDQVHHRPGLAA